MRGCAKKDRKPKKMGRGCNVVIKPAKKRCRRRNPFKMLRPVVKGLRAFAR